MSRRKRPPFTLDPETIAPGAMTKEEKEKKKNGGPKPPPGFTLDALGRAEEVIRDKLTLVSKVLEGSRIIIHSNKDGSVDGELVWAIPRGVHMGKMVNDLQDAFKKRGLGGGVWVSMGLRYKIKKDDEVYRKFKGMNEVGVNYQLAQWTNIAEEFLILKQTLESGLKKKYRRKAAIFFIRFNWNPGHKQPSRY